MQDEMRLQPVDSAASQNFWHTALGGEDDTERQYAVCTIQARGFAARPAIPALVNLLADPDSPIRCDVIKALGRLARIPIAPDDPDQDWAWESFYNEDMGDVPDDTPRSIDGIDTYPGVVPVLTKECDQPDENVRRTALASLNEIARGAFVAGEDNTELKESLPAVLPLVGDRFASVACLAVSFLQFVQPYKADADRVREALLAAAGALNPEIRAAAVVTMRNLALHHHDGQHPQRDEYLAVVAGLLADDDDSVSHAAVVTFKEMGPVAQPFLPQVTDALLSTDTLWPDLGAIIDIGPDDDILPVLIQLLRHERSDWRGEALRVLGAWKSNPAVPQIVKALESDHEISVRRGAARALRQIGSADHDVITALTESLRDDELQLAAIDALGHIGPAARGKLPALMTFLKHEDPELRSRAAMACSMIDPTAEVFLEQLNGEITPLEREFLLTVSDAATCLGVDVSTITRQCDSGALRSVGKGKPRRVFGNDVLRRVLQMAEARQADERESRAFDEGQQLERQRASNR